MNIGTFSNEIQSWIAVNSFAAEDAHPNSPIIDANELADFISSLVSKHHDEANISNLSPDTNKLIDNFAHQMKVKLVKAQEKYGFKDDWKNSDWETKCRVDLYQHLNKGDPIDVANYCAFSNYHGWSTKFENSAYSLMPREPNAEMMVKALEAIKSEIGKEHIDVKIIHAWSEMFAAFNGIIKPQINLGITLTCEALLEAFQFGAPDYDNEDSTADIQNQLSTEMTIVWWENGHSGNGYYAYYTEYPEEGSIKLGGNDE
ncbi:hypothetical protein [Acinetobacter sp. AG1]|uniref:hypothetical protein n=1 Tax=Acinetobacter sp. AG1 TaxID=348388 RepID=UPI00069B1D72|nr:hypothetical protein [Acinetobacter sp. AG1]